MKRFIVITVLFSVSILAFWVIFDAFAAPPPVTKNDTSPIVVRNETDEMLEASQSGDLAAPVMGTDVKIAPVFDVTGTVVSDPTGTMLNTNQSGDLAAPATGMDMKMAPVFDSTGAIVSDPTGTVLSAVNP